jgi:hypothetical protein
MTKLTKRFALTVFPSLLIWTSVAMQASTPPPFNCQYAGRALGIGAISLGVNIFTGNPIGFGISSFGFYFAFQNWVKCQEANNQDPSRW